MQPSLSAGKLACLHASVRRSSLAAQSLLPALLPLMERVAGNGRLLSPLLPLCAAAQVDILNDMPSHLRDLATISITSPLIHQVRAVRLLCSLAAAHAHA
jgi:hypothetical protein